MSKLQLSHIVVYRNTALLGINEFLFRGIADAEGRLSGYLRKHESGRLSDVARLHHR